MSQSLIVTFFSLLFASQAPEEAASAAAVSPVAISVSEMDATLPIGADRSSRALRLGLRISIQNNLPHPILIERSDLALVVNGKSVIPGAPESEGALNSGPIEPNHTRDGWIWYTGIPFSGKEVPLTLRCLDFREAEMPTERTEKPRRAQPQLPANGEDAIPSKVIELDLNKEFRRLTKFERKHLGPDGELIVYQAERSLDLFSLWVLEPELTRLSADGLQRVVFVPSTRARTPMSDEFLAWLSDMVPQEAGASNTLGATPPPVKSDLKFQYIAVAQQREESGRPFRAARRAVSLYPTLDDAVCAALTSAYRFVPVEKAIADLKHPEAGVRRAAIAGAIDRLTVEQASSILKQAESGSEALQLEVASFLNLIPGQASVDALRDMCLSQSSKVAAVALRALARSRDESATAAMAEVWKAGETTPALQSDIVQAIVECADDRWTPFVADYVATFLKQSTQPAGGTIPAESIAGALRALEQLEHTPTLFAVREELLNIRNPDIQDMFLQYLMQSSQHGNEAVIRSCVTRRLADGQTSYTVANAAAAYRDPEWTDALLVRFEQGREDRSSAQYLHAVLECASYRQLDRIIELSNNWNADQRSELLQHLFRAGHPAWRQMAAERITKPNERSAEVVQLLALDASEESLEILRSRLASYVTALEGTADASVQGQHFFQTLLSNVSMFVHPECRRIMNRLSYDSNAFVSERAARLKADAYRRSPAFRSLVQESQLRQSQKNDEADQALEDCTLLDPLLPEIYVRRASVRMHASRFQESMADLRVADDLSPDDIEVQSMIALVMVRMEETDKGVAFAEKVIEMAPLDWTTLYNGACTFARATENSSPTSEEKTRYAGRAIELLRKTAELKFRESDHMLNDADLFSLHAHPDWQNVVDLVKANKAAAPAAPDGDQ